jgi:hypothetical protein
MIIAIAGIAATLVAAGIGAWAALHARRRPRAVLELIDATVSYPPGKQTPVVDVKVVNRGGQTAVIKRVQVTIVRAAGWPDWSRPFAIRPRSFYGEGALSPRGGVWQPGYGGGPLVTSAHFQPQVPDPFHPVNTINLPVAHQVPAGEADRFDIVLSMPPRRVCHVDLLKLVLLYDSDSREVKLPPIAVVSTQFPAAIPPEEVASGLLQFEKEIKTVDAARASAGADAEPTFSRDRTKLQGMVLTEDCRNRGQLVRVGETLSRYY